MSRIDQPRMIRALRSYFASGWAFLIPYQLAYLLYYWRQWPSNPGTETAAKTAIPSLLAVYWAMHALHIALALIACAKREEGKVKGEKNAPGGDDQGRALHRHQLRAISYELLATTARRLLSLFPLHSSIFRRPFTSPFTLHSSLFWISLALLFYIPGVYLEFPSDPWEHLRRINEWKAHEVVHWHAAGYKSLYFFAYSLVGWIRASSQMPALNFYYTGMCLLLSWQYYLLARATGLPKRWAQGFALLHLLIAGNVSFSFFRYYGIASTAFSQLGAIVLIRLTITWVKQKGEERNQLGAISSKLLASGTRLRFHFSLFFAALCAALLVVNNHVQGLGIAALGCASVLAWKIVRWPRRAWKGWLSLLAMMVVGSFATYHLWPRSPQFAALIPQGWITAWYGFSLLAPASPAFDRMIQILGGFGLLNLAAGIYLITRRQLAGWLSLFPVVLLSLPLGAIPIADKIIRGDNIITYHRMFFAIPAGLALVALLRELTLRGRWAARGQRSAVSNQLPATSYQLKAKSFTLHSSSSPFALALTGLLAISVIPASKPWFNRTWQVLAQVPEDLSLRSTWQNLANVHSQRHEDVPEYSAHGTPTKGVPALDARELPAHSVAGPVTLNVDHSLASTMAVSCVFNTQTPSQRMALGYSLADGKAWGTPRHYGNSARSPAQDFESTRNAMAQLVPLEFLTISPTAFYTPYSQAALTSGHWVPQEVPLATTGMPEIESIAQAKRLQPHHLPGKTTLWKSTE